jgi:outer membrane lipoprotein-sorting protein
MFKNYISIILMIISFALNAESAKSIIKKIDKNDHFITQEFSAIMTIKKGNRVLVKTFTGYGYKNGKKSYMKFTNAEDLGVKYLKIKKELWIYFPDADDIMKISGHMLRQGMMGSDISYEDMLEGGERDKKYSSKLLDDKIVDGKSCFVIELKAKVKDAPYEKQVLFVDKSKYIPLKMEMFARGGRLLKKITTSNHKTISGRVIPFKMTIQDTRKRNSKTTIEFKKVKFNIKLPKKIFTKRMLKR